jgi:hypothetical protein
MNRVEMQRALYNERNAYLKAKLDMEFHANEIRFLNECIKAMDAPALYDELFVNA